MGAGHPDHLYVEGSSPIHRLPAECKVAATVLFVLGVVATPREAFWAFGVHAAVLAVAAGVARLRPWLVARRLTIELPFVAFALALPFLAGGDRVDVGPVAVSGDGLWGAWNILVKATLGVGASVVLTATTTVPELVRGLERLRLPAPLLAILTFMVRYVAVIHGEMQRMAIARVSRGDDPRWLWQARATARTAGTLFVRAYERGERVHLAMLARGYAGAMPRLHEGRARRVDWAVAALAPAVAFVVASSAWAVRA